MEENKIKPGPIQQLWLSQLRQHPDRQLHGSLGEGNPDNYKACCLGELLLCKYRIEEKPFPFVNRILSDNEKKNYLDPKTSIELGMVSETGSGVDRIYIRGEEFENLASMNDNGFSWPEIADYVEANFDNFFTKSV